MFARIQIKRSALLFLSVILLAFAVEAQSRSKVADRGLVMWEPVDVRSQDLFLGPGGRAMMPDLSSISFVSEQKGGYSTKYRIKDGSGNVWVAKIGREQKRITGPPPKIETTNVKVTVDPVDGPEATGSIVNRSGVEQRKLTVFGVVRTGGKIVAAGRGQVNRLKAHKKSRFQIFFIGDPRRGRLTVSAPPTVLG